MKRASAILAGLVAVYLLLLIPSPSPEIAADPDRQAFVWDGDEYWEVLEAAYQQARGDDCDDLADAIEAGLSRLDRLIVSASDVESSSPILDSVQRSLFELAPSLAVCPQNLGAYMTAVGNLRRTIKSNAFDWDLTDPDVRGVMYRLLYGSRIAVEEILLQLPYASQGVLYSAYDESSETPSAELLGITIHSGDILISRGGAPTSALIARGNDFPGNFSHIALVHVNSTSHQISIIESHIECGVAVATPEQYLADTKLRVLALRPRADLPQLIEDPMLPHKVATAALRRARREHIPYDFAMDFEDSTALFCSEVASYPYREFGLDLWMGMSHMSGAGIRSWLAAFGVENFETQAPSDLEYDPQLRVVAEWRDPETLYQDHVDNAILDAMLEQAENQGSHLEYDWYMLPVGRVLKAYSVVLNWFGEVGPIPEGMDAAAALRNDRFSTRHRRVTAIVLEEAEEFQAERGYRPPYWELVKMARQTVAEY